MAAKKPWFEIRRSAIQGKGAFAVRDIPDCTKLIEYVGERITADEASARYDDSRAKRHHTFLFELDEQSCIDAKRVGNDARYINHSCDPNCEAVIEGKRIFIYSIADMPKGTELVYDYSYMIDGPLDAETRALYACKCGSPKCRGTIAVSRPKKKRAAAKKKSGTKASSKKTSVKTASPKKRTTAKKTKRAR
jgi:SET domain-containing protein